MMKQVLTEIEKQIRQSGILFDVNDMPILPKSMILREEPEELIPFEHRGVAKNLKKTAICFFSKDLLLEQRIRNLVSNLPEYGKYMGVTGFDLSIRIGMALESQLMFARINKMIDCYFAINGIKVLPNFRVGEIGSISSILNYEKGTMYAAGIIGCKNGSSILDDAILRAKLIYARPTKILTYGMPRANSTRILRDCGVCYRPYEDFRKRSYRGDF